VIQSIDTTACSVIDGNVDDSDYNDNNNADSDTHLLMSPPVPQFPESMLSVLKVTVLVLKVTVSVLEIMVSVNHVPPYVPTSAAVPVACCRCSAGIL
jgi:hypothetical protein